MITLGEHIGNLCRAIRLTKNTNLIVSLELQLDDANRYISGNGDCFAEEVNSLVEVSGGKIVRCVVNQTT